MLLIRKYNGKRTGGWNFRKICTFWSSAKPLLALGGWSEGWFFNNWPFRGRQIPGEGYFPPLYIKHIFWDINAGVGESKKGDKDWWGNYHVTFSGSIDFPHAQVSSNWHENPPPQIFPPLVHDNYRLNLVYISTWKKVLLYLSSWIWLPNLIARYHSINMIWSKYVWRRINALLKE